MTFISKKLQLNDVEEHTRIMDFNIRAYHNDNEVFSILYIIWVVAYVKILRRKRRIELL